MKYTDWDNGTQSSSHSPNQLRLIVNQLYKEEKSDYFAKSALIALNQTSPILL